MLLWDDDISLSSTAGSRGCLQTTQYTSNQLPQILPPAFWTSVDGSCFLSHWRCNHALDKSLMVYHQHCFLSIPCLLTHRSLGSLYSTSTPCSDSLQDLVMYVIDAGPWSGQVTRCPAIPTQRSKLCWESPPLWSQTETMGHLQSRWTFCSTLPVNTYTSTVLFRTTLHPVLH